MFAQASRLPEASSTLLRMHRLYTQQPPHDSVLYDTLQVNPNATAAEITKSYRRLSRKYHPDKRRRTRKSKASSTTSSSTSSTATEGSRDNDENDEQDEQQQLERIREAYEVLKEDSARLPYHRYGLVDTGHALVLLTGRTGSATDPQLSELLRMMGYQVDLRTGQALDGDLLFYSSFSKGPTLSSSSSTTATATHLTKEQKNQKRVWFLAVNLVETIRPLVEGAVSEAFMADIIASQCDRLKRLPLGAQILRCIGRAYRYSGQRFLRRYHVDPKGFYNNNNNDSKNNPLFKSSTVLLDVSDHLRDQWRNAKHVLTAAMASGRVVLSEEVVKRSRRLPPVGPGLPYKEPEIGVLPNDRNSDNAMVEEINFFGPCDDDLREEERNKAREVLLESLQLEALWKISKIDLDRTIRDACDLILDGDFFFFPGQAEGWVGSTGMAIDAKVGRVRAAAALAMIGDIMVQRSKEGTSWMQ